MTAKDAILSSDAGEPLFSTPVECVRMRRGFMRAFGLNEDGLHRGTVTNSAVIVARA